MAIMTGLLGLFFPNMSVLGSMAGWGPFYPILLIVGCYCTIWELYSKGRWASAGILILLFPLFCRAFDIRSSVSGFTLTIWALFFSIRYCRTRTRADLAGATLAFACAWQY